MPSDQGKDNMVKETEAAKPGDHRYTYADYLSWPDDKRYELIDGIVYNMAPAPSRIHQKLLGKIHNQMYSYLEGKKCEAYLAPFDVRLPEGQEVDKDITTVVQPDLVVVCDPEKLDDNGCKGAPDLIIEILSPSSENRDREIKKYLYERAGVREYWIVDYNEKIVEVYILDEEDRYGEANIYFEDDSLSVYIFPDFKINLKILFRSL